MGHSCIGNRVNLGSVSTVGDQPDVLAWWPSYTINCADFRHRRVSLCDDLLLWGHNLTLGIKCTEIEFASHYVRLPLVRDLASLKIFQRNAPQWLVIRFSNQHGLVSQVHQRLRNSHYSDWPALQAFALGPSIFRRQLEREGFSYQEIKGEVRRDLAFEQLRQSKASIGDIAVHLRLSGAQHFLSRIQKMGWESPGKYRAGGSQ